MHYITYRCPFFGGGPPHLCPPIPVFAWARCTTGGCMGKGKGCSWSGRWTRKVRSNLHYNGCCPLPLCAFLPLRFASPPPPSVGVRFRYFAPMFFAPRSGALGCGLHPSFPFLSWLCSGGPPGGGVWYLTSHPQAHIAESEREASTMRSTGSCVTAGGEPHPSHSRR